MTDASHNSGPSANARDSQEPADVPIPEPGEGEYQRLGDHETLPQPVDRSRPATAALGFLADVSLQVEVRVGGAQVSIGQLLELSPGAVVALERRAEDPVEVVAAGRVIARGEMVVVDDGLGVRITELCGGEAGE